MRKPLRGLRVVEIGTYVATPSLGSILGMLGAEVVKVEPIDGDTTRALTPWAWVNYNWNKKSVCINLKEPSGIQIFNRIVKQSRVFVEGLSPEAVEKLGIGYDKLRKINPRLIYCSIKGFSTKSAHSERVAFDTVAQAEGGLMYATQRRDTPPARTGAPCVDLTAGAYGAIGILAALLSSSREGAFIEVPLLDTVLYWNGYWMPYIDMEGDQPKDLGGSHPGFSPYGIYKASDGYIFIGTISEQEWTDLARILKLPTPARFDTMEGRVLHREEVNAAVADATSSRTIGDLVGALGSKVPCARVNTLLDVHSNEEFLKRGIFRKIEHGGKEMLIALPPIFGADFLSVKSTKTPAKGSATTRVMRRMGYDSKAIRVLRRRRIIA